MECIILAALVTFGSMNVVQKIFLHSSKVKIALHIGYWAFYMLCVSTILFKSSETSEIFTIGKYAIWLAVSMPFKWVIFYGYYYILIPKWFTDKTWKFFGITISLLLVYPFVKYGLDQLVGTWSIPTLVVNTEDKEPYVDYLIEFFRRFYTPLFLIIFAFFMRFVLDWFRNIRIKEKMEREQLKSELAMLKNQVSPHFLFNVLNNIDTLVYPHSKEASEAIVKLSSIMRYMLYETNSDKVIIGKEIEYLEAYIELQKMRLKDPSKIKFDASSVDSSSLIAPMLLVPFVENAFKHAAAISGPEIELSVTTTNDSIHFHIINNINNTIEEQKDEVGGIGLKNVHRRLELLYPGKHDLSISNNGESFEVTLKLSTEE
ncbi:MAG: histidine kinase [Crocinitomicaceae bacterium]|nr:histidine kinase [Crocinitomicaceae bacterium]